MSNFFFRLSLLILLTSISSLHAQVKKTIPGNLLIPENGEISDSEFNKFLPYFNDASIQATHVSTWKSTKGLFVIYEKLDTLTFDDPFFKDKYVSDYTRVGLAFYTKSNSGYVQQFANDHAFFCSSCNNMKSHGITVEDNKITLYISWGPSIAYATNHYSFQYNGKDWILSESQLSLMDDGHNATEELSLYAANNKINLATFDAEFDSYDDSWPKASKSYGLEFNVDTIASLRNALARYPKKDYDQLHRILNKDVLQNFLYMAEVIDDGQPSVSTANVTALNDIAFYMEQANILDAAAYLLDPIIKKYPNREVARLNRGDVYHKEGLPQLAKQEYQEYIRLMKLRKLESRIPKRLLEYGKE